MSFAAAQALRPRKQRYELSAQPRGVFAQRSGREAGGGGQRALVQVRRAAQEQGGVGDGGAEAEVVRGFRQGADAFFTTIENLVLVSLVGGL